MALKHHKGWGYALDWEKQFIPGGNKERTMSFYKTGDGWHVGDEGKESLLKDLGGMSLIHALLRNPDEGISAIEVHSLARSRRIGATRERPRSKKKHGMYVQIDHETEQALENNLGFSIRNPGAFSREEWKRISDLYELIQEKYESCTDPK